MAVISCRDISEGRGGGDDSQSRHWTRVFRVITDDGKDGPITVLQAPGLPAIGDPYSTTNESDSLTLAKSRTPNPTADECVWEVTIEYATDFGSVGNGGATAGDGSPGGGDAGGAPGQGGQSPKDWPTSPLERRTEWKRSPVKVRKAVTRDKNNDLVMNSAAVAFNPPYEIEKSLGQWTATKNYASFTEDDCKLFENRFNDVAYRGFAAATLKCDGIALEGAFENDTAFVRVTWTFLYDEDGWNPVEILDRGYQDIFGVPFYDGGGNPQEQLLDGTGNLGDPDNPFYLEFQFLNAYDATDARLP